MATSMRAEGNHLGRLLNEQEMLFKNHYALSVKQISTDD